MFERNFADVSSNNGNVNIARYHAMGYFILAIKATEGKTFINPLHRGQALNCGQRHMVVVHYHFARPDLGNAARDEAIHFLRACNGLLGPRDFVVLDMERGGAKVQPEWSVEFDKTIQEFSRFHTIPYASRSVLQESDQWVHGNVKRVWDADYSTAPSFAPPGYRVAFRQFTDGHVGPTPHEAPGIGACDMNRVVDVKMWTDLVQTQRMVHHA